MEDIANVRYDKKYKNAIYATEDKSMISVEVCVGQDSGGKDIFEPNLYHVKSVMQIGMLSKH